MSRFTKTDTHENGPRSHFRDENIAGMWWNHKIGKRAVTMGQGHFALINYTELPPWLICRCKAVFVFFVLCGSVMKCGRFHRVLFPAAWSVYYQTAWGLLERIGNCFKNQRTSIKHNISFAEIYTPYTNSLRRRFTTSQLAVCF